jgi:hypothetical protein
MDFMALIELVDVVVPVTLIVVMASMSFVAPNQCNSSPWGFLISTQQVVPSSTKGKLSTLYYWPCWDVG